MLKKKILIISILLNLFLVTGAVYWFINVGGIPYIKDHLTSKKYSPPQIKIRDDALSLLGSHQKKIVFLGDSHTNYFEWGEYFNGKSIANRGVAMDTTSNMVKRLNGVNELQPEKIFIMAGINDLQQGVKEKTVLLHYKTIIDSLLKENPQAHIYIQSTMQVNVKKYKEHFYKDASNLNEMVPRLNKQLKSLEGPQITYIDINRKVSGDNQLNPELTVDGLHLNKKGYQIWVDAIESYVSSK
ncbi:GDSL-type esterase/lipase family protein [Bacillus sp. 1P06AnD]|uniref:GDSL-type esterase/lipase family protein n=1 Tax=Bacillus sp. 1P06AnD TaxID=3132208 RepID=UPI0039A24705